MEQTDSLLLSLPEYVYYHILGKMSVADTKLQNLQSYRGFASTINNIRDDTIFEYMCTK